MNSTRFRTINDQRHLHHRTRTNTPLIRSLIFLQPRPPSTSVQAVSPGYPSRRRTHMWILSPTMDISSNLNALKRQVFIVCSPLEYYLCISPWAIHSTIQHINSYEAHPSFDFASSMAYPSASAVRYQQPLRQLFIPRTCHKPHWKMDRRWV